MKHSDAHELLQDFIGIHLPAEQQAAVAAHVMQCAECRQEVAALRALIARAQELPPAIEPDQDLWPAIAARLDASPPASRTSLAQRLGRLLASPGGWIPALGTVAAVVLIVIFTTVPHNGSDAVVPVSPNADIGRGGSTETVLPDPGAIAVVRALDEECRQRDHQLKALATADPDAPGGSIIDVIGTNLEIVNQAIGEARRAWQANPSCPQLIRLLTAVYRAKATLQGEALQLATQAG